MSYFSELSKACNESLQMQTKYSCLCQMVTYLAIAVAFGIMYLIAEPFSLYMGVDLAEGLKKQKDGDLFAIIMAVSLVLLMFIMYASAYALFGFLGYKAGWLNKSEFIKISLYYRVPQRWLKEQT